jgi:hypothetical protein
VKAELLEEFRHVGEGEDRVQSALARLALERRELPANVRR